MEVCGPYLKQCNPAAALAPADLQASIMEVERCAKLGYRLLTLPCKLAEAGELYASWFIARLVKVEQRLLDREYLCAGRFTVADIAITYALLLARLIGLGDRMPARINDYLDTMMRREGFGLTQEKEQQAARAASVAASS